MTDTIRLPSAADLPELQGVARAGPLTKALAVSGAVVDLCCSSGERTSLSIANSGCVSNLGPQHSILYVGQTGTAAQLISWGTPVYPSGMPFSVDVGSGVRLFGVSALQNTSILNVRVMELN